MESDVQTIMKKDDVQKLVDGLLDIYQKPLIEVSNNVKELISKQEAVLNRVHEKNEHLHTSHESEDMKKMFTDIANCRERLVMIKKQMLSIHDRANKLKTRSHNVLIHAKNQKSARMAKLEQEQKLIGGHNS